MSRGEPTIGLVDAVGDGGPRSCPEPVPGLRRRVRRLDRRDLRFQGFDAEVAGLPGRYAPPSGCLLLAMDGDIPAGCVALRDLGDGTCEMKRLYVTPEHRGRGLGRLLVEEVLRRAERMGYRRMVLDSLPEMAGAFALYRQHGFVETAPYWGHPTGHAIFMERSLGLPGS